MTTLPEFITARLDEREAEATEHQARGDTFIAYDTCAKGDDWLAVAGDYDPARELALVEALRRIVELHEGWPVLMMTEPKMEEPTGDYHELTYRLTQQLQWATEREYRARFGEEPPTAPMLRALAGIWVDHPDYQQEWAL